MEIKTPIIFDNGVMRLLRNNETVTDQVSSSIAIHAISLSREPPSICNTHWRDEYVAGDYCASSQQAMPNEENIIINNINYTLLSFNGNNIEEGVTNAFEINHDVNICELNNEDVNLEFHIHYLPSSNNSGDVKWIFNYTYLPYNGISNDYDSLNMISSIDYDSKYKHSICQCFVTKPVCSYNIGDIILFNIIRDPTDIEDTYQDKVLMLKCALHVPINCLGTSCIL